MAIRKKGKSKDRQHKPPERTSFWWPLCCLSFHLPFFLMACVVCPSIYPSFWWPPSERRVNGRTDNTSHQKEG
jgi:hypothetical protein